MKCSVRWFNIALFNRSCYDINFSFYLLSSDLMKLQRDDTRISSQDSSVLLIAGKALYMNIRQSQLSTVSL